MSILTALVILSGILFVLGLIIGITYVWWLRDRIESLEDNARGFSTKLTTESNIVEDLRERVFTDLCNLKYKISGLQDHLSALRTDIHHLTPKFRLENFKFDLDYSIGRESIIIEDRTNNQKIWGRADLIKEEYDEDQLRCFFEGVLRRYYFGTDLEFESVSRTLVKLFIERKYPMYKGYRKD